jgi:hypothetical protein
MVTVVHFFPPGVLSQILLSENSFPPGLISSSYHSVSASHHMFKWQESQECHLCFITWPLLNLQQAVVSMLSQIITTTSTRHSSNQPSLHKSHGFTNKAHWVIANVLMQGVHTSTTNDLIHSDVQNAKCTTYLSLQTKIVPQRGVIHIGKWY